MKKLILLFIIAFLQINLTSVKAQTYYSLVDTNRLWSVKFTSCESPFPSFQNYFAKFLNDTVIGAFQYKKVFTSSDTTLINWSHHGYIREDSSKKIFYRNSSGYEGLIYDFSANIGDTVYIKNTNILDTTVQMVVYNIDSIFIYNKYLKRIILNHDSINPQYDEIWIDRIGSMNGILHSCRNAYFYPGLCYELLCYSENDTLKYLNPNYSSCYYIQVGIDEYSQNSIKCSIYPNPVISSSTIQLENPNGQKCLMEIYNVIGEKIKTLTFEKNIEVIINKYDYVSGLYIYKIETKSSNTILGKIIIF